MKAVVVGVAGFLGSALGRRLLEGGWEVVGYDVASPEPMPVGLGFHRLDVLRDELAFPRDTDAVFYLAQSPFYRRFPEDADHLFGVNTYGAIKAAQAACRAGSRLFCYTSSGNVYAPSLEPLGETDPLRRDDPYALSKLAAEEALMVFVPRMPVLVLRLFGLFGPGQKGMLPGALLARIRAGHEILLEPAAGEGHRTEGLVMSFTYVEDAARIMEYLARFALQGKTLPSPRHQLPSPTAGEGQGVRVSAGGLPAVLNLAGPEPISIRRFAEELGQAIGIQPRFARAPTMRRGNLIADLGLLRAILDPAYVPFSEAMARTYAQPPTPNPQLPTPNPQLPTPNLQPPTPSAEC